MRNRRTPQPPLFDLTRPGGNHWSWVVTYRVASSGYPTACHVSALRIADGENLAGSASCAVLMHDDLREVIECLATESMLAACEPNMFDLPNHRDITYTSHF